MMSVEKVFWRNSVVPASEQFFEIIMEGWSFQCSNNSDGLLLYFGPHIILHADLI
jgi:hypothetical protein